MKPKPLKGQRCDINESHHVGYYLGCDVESAVEWMKLQLRKKMRVKDGVITFNYLEVGDIIDNAFPDLRELHKRGK